jgi:hypothetical protein
VSGILWTGWEGACGELRFNTSVRVILAPILYSASTLWNYPALSYIFMPTIVAVRAIALGIALQLLLIGLPVCISCKIDSFDEVSTRFIYFCIQLLMQLLNHEYYLLNFLIFASIPQVMVKESVFLFPKGSKSLAGNSDIFERSLDRINPDIF